MLRLPLPLPLFKVLSCSLLALNVASNLPSFGGNLTKQYEEAQSLDARKAIALQGVHKIEARLIQEETPERVKKLEAKLITWKERIEETNRKKMDLEEELSFAPTSSKAPVSSENSFLFLLLSDELQKQVMSHLSIYEAFRLFLTSKNLMQKFGNDQQLYQTAWMKRYNLTDDKNRTPKQIVLSQVFSTEAIIAAAREDITLFHKLLHRAADMGQPWALFKKAIGLAVGKHGYKEDEEAANGLLEEYVKKGQPWAIELKFAGLLTGGYGYKKG